MNKDIVLIDFNALMSYDYGIIVTMLNNYYNEDAMDNSFLSLTNVEQYSMLQNRTHWNPLDIIMKDRYKSSMNSLLEELMEKDLDDIYQHLIVHTNIFKVINACNKNKLVDVTVCCKNETEEHIIKNLFGYDTVMENEVIYSHYDTFFIHHSSKLIGYPERYIGKCVYMAMTRYNLFYSKEHNLLMLTESILDVIVDRINLKLIALYSEEKENNNASNN